MVIGFIGLGTMGKPMAKNLLSAGFEVVVHNRSRGAVEELVAAGAVDGGSPAGVAEKADVVISMVPDSPDVEMVYLWENGALESVREGQILIDMSTVAPSTARKVYDEVRAKGAGFLDAPVSGGEAGAIAATLSIMVGGDKEAFDKVLPVFEALGKNIVYMGPSGAGQSAKLCNQVICGLNILATAEGLMLGIKSGLDPELLLKAISAGSAGSWMLSNLGPKMISGDMKPGFKVALQQKDLRLALDAAREVSVPLVGTAVVNQIFQIAESHGLGEQGTQAMIEALARLAGDRGLGSGDGE